MIGDLLKRFVNGVVVVLAALTFFLVPVGRKTPAQHLVAIFTTPPAREAAAAFKTAVKKLYDRVAAETARLR